MNTIAIEKIHNDDVRQAVFKALDGIKAQDIMSRKGLTVLLKPNLLSAKPPERAVTTHPAVVRAVIQWVKQFEPAEIYVCDSSGGIKPGTTEKSFEVSGVRDVCEQEGAVAVPFEKTERRIYKVERPLVLNRFAGSALLEKADIIINLPKIKTHGLTHLTCCIKNMFGLLPLANKPSAHARFPNPDEFCSALVDIYSAAQPQLTVVDGYYCMEGKGPGAGDVVKHDVILAGRDGVALDTAVCRMIHLPPRDVKYLAKAEAQGLGTTDLDFVSFAGLSIDSVSRPFKRANTSLTALPIPRFLADWLGAALSKATIRFDPEKCTLCGTCWKNCPGSAIEPPREKKNGAVPVWNRDKCIVCYCCAELCPYEAIDFELRFFKNLFLSPGGAAMAGAGVLVLLIAGWLLSLLF
jgi:uncharacterized protein (DUF362 family)/Pyruvate/2-oxoacid:ferredoxin oxidoreductase delta subunit